MEGTSICEGRDTNWLDFSYGGLLGFGRNNEIYAYFLDHSWLEYEPSDQLFRDPTTNTCIYLYFLLNALNHFCFGSNSLTDLGETVKGFTYIELGKWPPVYL